MAEIIDLISSSPPPPPSSRTRAKTSSPLKNQFNFDLDDSDATGDLDINVRRSVKRRKLTPPGLPPPRPRPQPTTTTSNLLDERLFDLSSDGDALPAPLEINQVFCPTSAQPDKDLQDVDLMPFSSSAPELSRPKSPQRPLVLDLSSDHETGLADDDPIQSSSQPMQPSRTVFSAKTTNLLASIRAQSEEVKTKAKRVPPKPFSRPAKVGTAQESKSDRFRRLAAEVVDNVIESSSQPEPVKKPSSKSVKLTEEDKAEKEAAKAASKASKIAEKEAERERKRLEKEQKQKEKQNAVEMAQVNKVKTNKKNATPEMILHLPSSLQGTTVGNQVEEYMKELDVRLFYAGDEEVNLVNDTAVPLGNVIRWRRRVVAEYNEDEEIWQPLPNPRVSTESHLIVYLKAEEFVALAIVGASTNDTNSVVDASTVSEATMKSNLDAHVESLRQRHPKCKPIYLIEGLASWHRKSQTTKNRAYIAAVRAQTLEQQDDSSTLTTPQDTTSTTTAAAAAANATTQRRPKKSTSKANSKSKQTPSIDFSSITPDTTDALLLHLQLTHQPLQIQHTPNPTGTSSQISVLTQHLSTRPYRLATQLANLTSASFCMTTGQIRTGSTPDEVWIQMLQEIQRVTPSMAYGVVAAGYKHPTALSRGFEKHGKEMLADVRKSVNKDGAWSDRRLGPMVSKRVYKVFMGRDPGSRDGMS